MGKSFKENYFDTDNFKIKVQKNHKQNRHKIKTFLNNIDGDEDFLDEDFNIESIID